ncbi:hypothetical protein D3C86_2003800 [compost metagenome]
MILVAIISKDSVVHLADFGNQGPPLRCASVGHDQFAADAEHFATAFFGNRGKMQNKSSVGAEPIRPFGLARNIFVEEVDVGAPSAVCAVHNRFQAYLKAK